MWGLHLGLQKADRGRSPAGHRLGRVPGKGVLSSGSRHYKMFATENSVSPSVVNLHSSVTLLSKCFGEERKREFFIIAFPDVYTLWTHSIFLHGPVRSSQPQSYLPLRYRCLLSHWDGSSASAGPLFSAGLPMPRMMQVVSKHVQKDEAVSAMVTVTMPERPGRWTPLALGGQTSGRPGRSPRPPIRVRHRVWACSRGLLGCVQAWGPPGRGRVGGGGRGQASVASWGEEGLR